MIIETLGHNWDVGVRACVKLATQGTIFFFFFFTFVCHLRRKQKIGPYINVTKTHKSGVNIKSCKTWRTCVPVYCMLLNMYRYLCTGSIQTHIVVGISFRTGAKYMCNMIHGSSNYQNQDEEVRILDVLFFRRS